MPKKLTMADIQKTAESKGGRCLSPKYINAREPMLWECSKGHTWEATTGNVRSYGSWCPECAGVAKNSIEGAREIARDRGGKCLSSRYKNNRQRLEWECSEGHSWKATWKSVVNLGTWCPDCAGNVKLTIEAMQALALSRGGRCLSDTYINVDTHLTWQCGEGHTFSATPDNVKSGRWCSKCYSSVGERISRAALSQVLKAPFPKARPKWLVVGDNAQLEFDGYNKDLAIAFEHQGVQHYSFQDIFHESEEDFEQQQNYDQIKRDRCAARGILLLEIPEIPSMLRIEDVKGYILDALTAGGYDVTDAMRSRKIDYLDAYVSSRASRAMAKLRRQVQEIDEGGIILSPAYINAHTKLKLQCGKGHPPWKATPASIRAGKWCRKCSGYAKLSLEIMQKEAQSRGGRCLSDTYVNNSTHMEWQCGEGHPSWLAVASSIRAGSWCPYCAGVATYKKEDETASEGGKEDSADPDPATLTKAQKALIAGTVICGSTVRTTGALRAQLIQTSKNREWLRWKAEQLGPFTSSLVEDSSGLGLRLLTTSSEDLAPFLSVYSSSSNQEGRRWVPYELLAEHTDHPFFLLAWYVEGNWAFQKQDVVITVKKSYSGEDIKRLQRLLRDVGFDKVGTSDDMIVMEGQAPKAKKWLEATIAEAGISFLPPIPDIEFRKPSIDLTPEKAARLNQMFGMSFGDIAEIYDVSRATCWRRAKECDATFDSNLSLDAATQLLADLDHKGWLELGNEEQEAELDRAVDILSKTPFPEPKMLSEAEFSTEFRKLREKKMALDSDKKIRPDSFFGLDICRPYFLNRYKALNKESPTSCALAWYEPKQLRQAVRLQFRYGNPAVPRRVRKAIQANLRTPTLFKPAQAKFICETYGKSGGWYWDPCAGYGGRLLGAMASGMNYIGTDVDLETIEGNRTLYSDLQGYGLVPDLEAQLVHQEAETFDPERALDLVFTSPPYFDRELYSSSDGQSYLNYGTSAGDWADGFLRPIFKTAWTRLRGGGHLVINIADLNSGNKSKETVPLTDLTIESATTLGFTLVDTVKMPLSNMSPRDHEPVFVFKKVAS